MSRGEESIMEIAVGVADMFSTQIIDSSRPDRIFPAEEAYNSIIGAFKHELENIAEYNTRGNRDVYRQFMNKFEEKIINHISPIYRDMTNKLNVKWQEETSKYAVDIIPDDNAQKHFDDFGDDYGEWERYTDSPEGQIHSQQVRLAYALQSLAHQFHELLVSVTSTELRELFKNSNNSQVSK
jgi:hypothetical protein